ncbi:MAG TPA: rod shape-determining protein RodA [Acidimicrobiia bacterium]|nr:rod shape-determining protein RodA [Acidimicrobiia bacterium]
MTMLGRVDLRDDPRRARPDVVMVGIVAVLTALGLILIYSASAPRLRLVGDDPNGQMIRQLIFVAIGIAAMIGTSLITDRSWRMVTPLIFAGVILLLLATITPLGVERQGAQRWIPFGVMDLQPSELAKPAVILALAVLLTPENEIGVSWRRIGKAAALVALPAALIFMQPDFGTMLVFGFITVVMLFMAGTTTRQLMILLVGGLLVMVAIIELDLLRDYQLARIIGFLNPGSDPLSVNYNQIQSQITIGNGGLFGSGLFQGAQTNLAFVPAQSTDFIFTALAEQLGFLGATVVLALYTVLIWRMLAVSVAARDKFAQLVAGGIAAMFAFHVFVNVGMTLGLLPVTGLPLPFMSFGGSFYLGTAVSVGIVNSIWMNRSPVPGDRRLASL